jgi:predicted small lipoprotein YifL
MKRLSGFLLILLAALAVAGCGNKGDLVRPQSAAATAAADAR